MRFMHNSYNHYASRETAPGLRTRFDRSGPTIETLGKIGVKFPSGLCGFSVLTLYR